jgi:uncharacterized protein (UPF0248 family)
MLRESDKHFLWSLLGAIGIILFWRGLWNGIDTIEGVAHWGWLGTPALSLFIGLVILTFSGLIFQQFDPLGGLERGVINILHDIHANAKKDNYSIKYHDRIKKRDFMISAENIRRIEKNILSIEENGKEIFIPIHRIREVHKKGKIIWKF